MQGGSETCSQLAISNTQQMPGPAIRFLLRNVKLISFNNSARLAFPLQRTTRSVDQ